MSAGLALQYVLIALAVLVSVGVVLQDRFPIAIRRGRVACALWLRRPARASWLQAVGKWIAPRPVAGKACGTCGSCGQDG
jgi:hypothetical protein